MSARIARSFSTRRHDPMQIHRRFTPTRRGRRLACTFALAGGLALAATVAAATDGVAPTGMMQG
ncbi:hypothetical protein A8E95_27460, partial [Burkholderia cenocepacia]